MVGALHRMRDDRIARQALKWSPADGKKKRGRPRKNWKATITDDLRIIGMDWEEAEQVAGDRMVWQSCVARCAEGTWKD